MRKVVLLLVVLGLISCKSEPEVINNNVELIKIYKADQSDRQNRNIDRLMVLKRDSLREIRVYELLDSNKVKTSLDYLNAAMIFQHGRDSIAFGMAVKLMKKSIELDSTANKWLLAAAIDRDLLSRNKPQIYGTQYWKMRDKPWELREIDTTKITDAERIKFGVETLAQQRAKVKRMNSKKIKEILNNEKSIEELIQIIKNEDKKETKYDISENGINNFAYQIMSQGKEEDALKIFKLNTELYPNGYNAFDSYGECLLKMGDKENAIIAYKKSLELNPKNKNAEEVLAKLR